MPAALFEPKTKTVNPNFYSVVLLSVSNGQNYVVSVIAYSLDEAIEEGAKKVALRHGIGGGFKSIISDKIPFDEIYGKLFEPKFETIQNYDPPIIPSV